MCVIYNRFITDDTNNSLFSIYTLVNTSLCAGETHMKQLENEAKQSISSYPSCSVE